MSSQFDHPDLDDLDPRDVIARDRLALAPVQESLKQAGFYAYGTLDDQSRWTIAVDDELGRVDVHVGDDGFQITLWMSSPGLYADEENEWKRRSRSRLARMTIPRIAQGFLEPHQTAVWDDVDEGVAVSEHYQLPFNRAGDVGAFVRAMFDYSREHGVHLVLTTALGCRRAESLALRLMDVDADVVAGVREMEDAMQSARDLLH